jgi:hypothetical protein
MDNTGADWDKKQNTHIGGTKMKFNKWTVALAAVGAVSLTSVAQAEEKMLLGSQAELTSTTISGYVSTSAHWDFGNDADAANTRGYSYSPAKGDGFNLDVVDITLEKALDENEWASGYKAELWFGPDATGIGTQFGGGGDVAIKQAFVALRTPIGNGIDWKIGVFDTIIGYESSNAGDNPNYTRSWGYSIEPTQHTGILGTYRFCDTVSTSFGVANTWDATINGRDTHDTTKTYLASVALTAPESFGFLHGGSLYAGIVDGRLGATAGGAYRTSYYLGASIPTPIEGLKAGVAFDYLVINNRPGHANGNSSALGGYLSFAATEKLTLNTRVDYIRLGGNGLAGAAADNVLGNAAFAPTDEFISTTLTADYQLWKNVISRAELRWDTDLGQNGGAHFRSGLDNNEFTLAANFIYKF